MRSGDGNIVAVSGETDLLQIIGGATPGIKVAVEDFCRVGSYAMDLPLVWRSRI